jgi:hypothetical protein
MQTGFWKKCLVLVIIILLMGISILPSMSGNVKKNNKKTVVDTNKLIVIIHLRRSGIKPMDKVQDILFYKQVIMVIL